MNTTALPVSSVTSNSAVDVDKLQSDSLLLDVRTPMEFAEAHIAGSVLHPLSNLDLNEIRKLAVGKNACVLICRSGKRANMAAEKLMASGLPNLSVLEGGVLAWDAAGLPLIRGTKVISLERQVRIAAGSLVFIGAALGYFVHPNWMALSAFVGAGLVFAGVTDTCAMAMLIARMRWNSPRLSGEGQKNPSGLIALALTQPAQDHSSSSGESSPTKSAEVANAQESLIGAVGPLCPQLFEN
jgi:rhodanese-related sulfurtransferase